MGLNSIDHQGRQEQEKPGYEDTERGKGSGLVHILHRKWYGWLQSVCCTDARLSGERGNMNSYQRLAALVLLVLTFGTTALADDRFETARAAANKGRFKEARVIWEELSAAGNVEATYNLGRMYARGDGVPRDFGRARDYFEEASDAGHVEATARLGAMYLHGDGVRKNQSRAFALLRKASDSGSEYAKDLAVKLGIPESATPSVVREDYPSPPALPAVQAGGDLPASDTVANRAPVDVVSPPAAELPAMPAVEPEPPHEVSEVAPIAIEEPVAPEVAVPAESEVIADASAAFDEPPPPPDQIIGGVSDLGAFVARNFSFKSPVVPSGAGK